MVNYNLTGDALLHCLKISGSKLLVVDEDSGCRQRIEQCRDRIERELGMQIVTLDQRTRAAISALPPKRPDDHYRKNVTGESPTCLFYTRSVRYSDALFTLTYL